MVACGTPPPATPAAGTATVRGTVRLVPHDGVPSRSGGDAYGDRRLHDVQLVDYSKPGGSVVYLDLGTQPGGSVQIAAEESLAGARLAPRFAVVGAGGEVAIANDTHDEVVVSVPATSRVERIAAGASMHLRADHAGPLEIFLLGADEPSRIWVSPGPWARPDASGHYELSGLAPGPATLRAWHPRLPSATAEVDLRSGETAVVNFEIGVGRGEGVHESH